MKEISKYPIVNISFVATGENLNLENITKTLNVKPTKNKASTVESNVTNDLNSLEETRQSSEWQYSKTYYNLFDLSIAYQKILDKFQSKIDSLNNLARDQKINYTLILSIDSYNGSTPAMVVDESIIHFLNAINAEINFNKMTFEWNFDDEDYLF